MDRKLGVYYGSFGLFSAVLHNVFLLYHVETFISIYKIDKYSFWIGETIFLFWNSFNDPLFGWISDKQYLLYGEGGIGVIHKRIQALSFNGPLLCISFLAFWISWTYPLLQLVICLCLYDGFLTMIDLHHSSLLADIAVSAETRTDLNYYCSIFNCIGSVSVFVSYLVWNKNNLIHFRTFCLIISLISLVGFYFCAKGLREHFSNGKDFARSPALKKQKSMVEKYSGFDLKKEKAALKIFLRQLSHHQNFVWFSAMNLIQVFHCHFNSNFFPLFVESLLVGSITPATASFLLGISFVAPHINNLYFLSLCKRYSLYTVIRWLFIIKLTLTIIMFSLGPDHIFMLCIFIASNRVFTEGTCKLLNLVISDLVDEDYVIHGRHQAVSALLYGTAAFVAKPGQTFAPLLGYWLLSVQTGHDVFESGNSLGSLKIDTDSLKSSEISAYRVGVFRLLISVPIVCAVLQLLAWSRYTLRGKRLLWIKDMRAGSQYTSV